MQVDLVHCCLRVDMSTAAGCASSCCSSYLCGAAAMPQVWLKQPLVVLEDIVERHDAVEAFATDPELRERLRDQSFRGAVPVSSGGVAHHMPWMYLLQLRHAMLRSCSVVRLYRGCRHVSSIPTARAGGHKWATYVPIEH